METDKPDRLDALVAAQTGFSRTYAQVVIAEGRVLVNGRVITKPGARFEAGAAVAVNAGGPRFVGRGGEKLDYALGRFGIDADGKGCLDIGASTGGFTDCLLMRGARRVTAIDAGHGQLAAKLADDGRVTLIEKTNIRDVSPGQFGLFDIVVCDVSFISLTLIMPNIAAQMNEGADAALLVKPQFECGRGALNRRGVVTDERGRRRAFERVTAAARAAGLRPMGEADSPIAGGDGNKERFIWLKR